MQKSLEILTMSGYKLTKARLAVLEYLSDHHRPISARDLHKKLKQFDQASVYRTLKLFEDLRLVNIEIVEKEKIYCLATDRHHHIICEKCGYLEKIACKHSFGHFKNFINISHQLTLTGVCNKCAR